jgi:hypothetical protein
VTTRGGGTDAADAVGLWVTLLSNRAECWLRQGEPDFARLRVNTGARAAAVDVGSRYGALGADPGGDRGGAAITPRPAAFHADNPPGWEPSTVGGSRAQPRGPRPQATPSPARAGTGPR